MKKLKTLALGISIGVIYGLLNLLIIQTFHENVSISFVFILPLFMGAVPILFTTKAQLKHYLSLIVIPWFSVILFFVLCLALELDGTICVVIIIAPFLIAGTLGAFIARLIILVKKDNSDKLYFSLFIPLLFLLFESFITPTDYHNTVTTSLAINANNSIIWENIKNLKPIEKSEYPTDLIHIIGIPKPIKSQLEVTEGKLTRYMLWEKGIIFKQLITSWQEEKGFSYLLAINPDEIPPKTLDDHVMIGGRYFDLTKGTNMIEEKTEDSCLLTFSVDYRITSNINFYSKIWLEYIIRKHQENLLNVIKNRSEKKNANKVYI